jgi:alpha-1,2-mannosyltransferase
MFWFAAAGILGWPFAAALCAPFMLEELILLAFGDKTALWEAFVRIGRGVVSAFLLLVRLTHNLFSILSTDSSRPVTTLSTSFSTRNRFP